VHDYHKGSVRKAAEEGLPYQTLISSILYKFSAGRPVDASAIRRVVAALKQENPVSLGSAWR
jgi:hypothetical protein